MRSALTLVVAAMTLISTVIGVEKNGAGKIKHLPYAGGHVKSGAIPVYFILYGSWTADNNAVPLFTTFVNGLGATKWWEITKLYKDSNGNVAGSGGLLVKGTYNDKYSAGNKLDYKKHKTIVQSALANGHLPVDPSGIYALLISRDVKSKEFCTGWCGYHDFINFNSTTTKLASKPTIEIDFAVVANSALSCPQKCASANPSVSPNGNPGVDAMLNVLAHEISEAVSDPHMDGWTAKDGTENGDMCNLKFGITTRLSSGAQYNLQFGGRKWLVQQMWNPNKNKCTMTV